MNNILKDILDGKGTILLSINNSLGQNRGYIGQCSVGGISDVAVTTSYKLSQMRIITINEDLTVGIKKRIVDWISGNTLFKLQMVETSQYLGIVWPASVCNNPNILTVIDINDALSFSLTVPGLKIMNDETINLILTGKMDIRLRSTGNSAWNGKWAGVCGYGPCKSLTFGLLPFFSESYLNMISTDLQKINCCMNNITTKKCGDIPEYDCNKTMRKWCHDTIDLDKKECKCINSKSILPQCFDKECYDNEDAFFTDKKCDRSNIDCVGLYEKLKPNEYTKDIESVCGPYENLQNEYLETGRYLNNFDLPNLLLDNWISILLLVIIILTFFIYNTYYNSKLLFVLLFCFIIFIIILQHYFIN